MEEPQNDFDSVQWPQEEDHAARLPEGTKANGKRRQGSSGAHPPPDRNADETDRAGMGADGYLECTVGTPQKENEGTKDVYISYLITTHVSVFES